MHPMNTGSLESSVRHMLSSAGIPAGADLKVIRIPGGGNNRAFKVLAEGKPFFLKAYFQHPDDPRDRLGAEYAFCSFAWNHGIQVVPRPHYADRVNGMALYEYIQGRRMLPAEVDGQAVENALRFFQDINVHRHTVEARALPDASEACFSVEEHLARVERRLTRLLGIKVHDEITRSASDLISLRLAPLWRAVADRVREHARRSPKSVTAPLATSARRLSPSDFGFHNVIVEQNGALRYIDFEYAGWDDPAKTVCDFFCQVAVPVPRKYLPLFAAGVTAGLPEPDACRERIRLLMPVYEIKWCCIVLNDFLPADAVRRRFAGGGEPAARREKQLAAAGEMLARLEQSQMESGE